MLAVSMSPPVGHYPAVQRRPKLSLQTSELPVTYSASSKALSTIATPSAAVTPTTFNTFNNTFDLTHRPSPTTASPSAVRAISGQDHVSRSQSPRPKHSEKAYVVNLPYGIRPILKNTLFPGSRTNSVSASPRSSTRRVFFPAPKEVVFKNNIEEEIVTKIYTARHSDLFQPDDDGRDAEVTESTTIPESTVCSASSVNNSSISSESSVKGLSISSKSSKNGSSISISSSTQRPYQQDTSEVDSTESYSGRVDTNSTQVSTPASTKVRRKWEWTLTPLPQLHNENVATTSTTMPLLPQGKAGSEAPSIQSASMNERQSTHIRSSSPVRQASDISNNRSSETALPRPIPHATVSLPETSTSSHLTKLKLTLPRSPPHLQPQKQRRGGSLESSPSRKRKAECLDASAIARCDSSGVDCGNGETESSIASNGNAGTGQMGTKRRERAATF